MLKFWPVNWQGNKTKDKSLGQLGERQSGRSPEKEEMDDCKIYNFQEEKEKLLKKREDKLRAEVDAICDLMGVHFADFTIEDD